MRTKARVMCVVCLPVALVLAGLALSTAADAARRPPKRDASVTSVPQLASRSGQPVLFAPPVERLRVSRRAYTLQVPASILRRQQPHWTALDTAAPASAAGGDFRTGRIPAYQAEGNALVRALVVPPSPETMRLLDELGIPAIEDVPPIVIINPDLGVLP